MDILLFDPPYISLKGVATDIGYNIGLTSLAAYLINNGIETAIVTGDLLTGLPSTNSWLTMSMQRYAQGQRDYCKIINNPDHIVWKKVVEAVKSNNPKVVGIPYLTPQKYSVEKMANLIKNLNPEIKVIAGSFHPTFCPDETMQNPDIDFAVRGEGEIPLLRLMQELKKDKPDWKTVPGISYRDADGQVKSNSLPEPIANLDELPFPARDLVTNCDYKVYRVHSMITTRGCPYTCSFCADRRFWGGKIRRRSVENVVKEMKLIKDSYKVDSVDFMDGTFTYDANYLRQFCNTVIAEKLNINWGCTARYDNLNPELLQLMKKSNCTGVYLGLESASNRVLKAMDKREIVEDILKVSKMIQDSGIPCGTSVLFGLPDEDQEDVEETIRVMKTFKTDLLDVNSFTPLPGTASYESMSEEEKKNIDWHIVGFKSFDNYFSKKLSQEEYRKYLIRAYKIADNLRIKSIIRIGFSRLINYIGRLFKKPAS